MIVFNKCVTKKSCFNLTSKGKRNKSSECHTQQLKCIVKDRYSLMMMLWDWPFLCYIYSFWLYNKNTFGEKNKTKENILI